MSRMLAGVGRADITPPGGIPAGGWGNQLHEVSEGNDLELWATVVVVEGPDGARAAILDVDLCILDDAQAARARSVVAEAARLAPDRVAAGTTHNHSVPVTLELGGAWIRRNWAWPAGVIGAATRDLCSEELLAGGRGSR